MLPRRMILCLILCHINNQKNWVSLNATKDWRSSLLKVLLIGPFCEVNHHLISQLFSNARTLSTSSLAIRHSLPAFWPQAVYRKEHHQAVFLKDFVVTRSSSKTCRNSLWPVL